MSPIATEEIESVEIKVLLFETSWLNKCIITIDKSPIIIEPSRTENQKQKTRMKTMTCGRIGGSMDV